MNLLEILDVLKKYEKNVYKIFRENKEYDKADLLSFHKDLISSANELREFKVILKNNLSRRRALIVLLQEFHFKDNEYPNDINLELYERKARVRFIIKNRDKTNSKLPSEIHPKKPHEFYQNDNYGMRYYREALELLAFMPDHYFINKDAIAPFLNILKSINE